jgi:hypothetical protein
MKKVALLATFAVSAFAAEWTGAISEAGCGAKHVDGSAKSVACVTGCVKKGAAPVFVTADGKVVKIANADKVTEHLGHKVKVTGKLDGETLTIDSVSMLQ